MDTAALASFLIKNLLPLQEYATQSKTSFDKHYVMSEETDELIRYQKIPLECVT